MTRRSPHSKSGLPRFVGITELAEHLGIHPRTISRRVRAGTFPKPVQLSPNRVGWPVDVILDWIKRSGAAIESAAVSDPEDLEPADRMAKAFSDIADVVEEETGRSIGTGMVLNIMEEGEAEAFKSADEARQLQMMQLQMVRRQFQDVDQRASFYTACIVFPRLLEILLASQLDPEVREILADTECLWKTAVDAMMTAPAIAEPRQVGNFAISGDDSSVMVKRRSKPRKAAPN